MLEVKEYIIDFAHRVDKCENEERFIHGHTGKILIKFIKKDDVFSDFGWLEQMIKTKLDHTFILDKKDNLFNILCDASIDTWFLLLEDRPITENIVRYLVKEIESNIVNENLPLQLFEVSFTEGVKNMFVLNKYVVECKDDMRM